MDIVSRLRQFMDFRNIPITQFADTCNIPRPTLSQLLNGRNKKVSDELIGKIHEAYPSLSVMWLMFGEGSMVNDENMQTSEPQIGRQMTFDESQLPIDDIVISDERPKSSTSPGNSENFRPEKKAEIKPETAAPTEISFIDDTPSKEATSQPAASDRKRKVSHIIVYYNDNTFETFVPDRR